MTSIELQKIGKRFDSTIALDAINLEIAKGELIFLLGPSGCGKSTLLRIIAGLLPPTSGRVIFDGRDVTALGTEQRNAVMCFQNYALWPHMTVRQNVGFGLSIRSNQRDALGARVDEVLRLVQIEQLAERKPNALSGGQQQRTALARALAVEPRYLLLDEPLSNLDAKLRLEMRGEIRRLCKAGGYTTIYVTHDQKEALSIADRIVVLNAGRIIQTGTPAELYDKPRSSFLAEFIGQTNLVKGTVESETAGALSIRTAFGMLRAAASGKFPSSVILSIRPERIRILSPASAKSADANHLAGKIRQTTFLGEIAEHSVEIGGQCLSVTTSPPMLQAGTDVLLEIDPADCVVLSE
jgi:iron(III) transport system ATP-binding protein